MKLIIALILYSILGCNVKQNSNTNTIEPVEVELKDKLMKAHSTLADALFKEKVNNEKVFPKEIQKEVNQMIQSFEQNTYSVLKLGDLFPMEMLPSSNFKDLPSNKTSVIYVIRGAWCPYSQLVLEDLNRYAEDFRKLQIPLIVLSTETREKLDEIKKQLGLTFDLISDSNQQIADACGLSQKVDKSIAQWYYKHFQMQMNTAMESVRLPIRSTFIVDSNGVIINRYLNPDHRTSPEGIDVLQSAAIHKYNVIKPAAKNYRPLTQFEKWVIEEKGTERAYTGEYWDHKDKGVYVCRKCNNPLYVSGDKFDSHCGWPSFDDEISKSVIRKLDADGYRTEILCSNCNGHLGHVFEGERFTDKNIRHCVNSVSVKFVPYQTKQ